MYQVTNKKIKDYLLIFIFFSFLILLSDVLCIFKLTIGIPCPGCGMTRAMLALLRFDIESAIYYNIFVFVVVLIPVVLLIKYILKNKSFDKIFNISQYFVIVFILVYYIVRMFNYFPNIEPMDYNYDSFLNKMILKYEKN